MTRLRTRTQFTAPDGSTNTYVYDTLSRLSALTDSGAGHSQLSYDGLSRRTQLARPTESSRAMDMIPVVAPAVHFAQTGREHSRWRDGGLGSGRQPHRRDQPAQWRRCPITHTMILYQLTGVTGTEPETYTFDPVGNRLTSLSAPNYTYNSSNEIAAEGASTYTYDNNGNTLTKTDGTGTTTYTWDFQSRLTSVHQPDQAAVTLKYIPLEGEFRREAAFI